MKGLAFRKLSRTSSHRRALLRNLVTSLFQHDRIVTTVAKAKEAARQAEKIITLGKRALAAGTVPKRIVHRAGSDALSHFKADAAADAARLAAAATGSEAHHIGKGRQAASNAHKYLYSPEQTLPHLYALAQRYAGRPGGYTRIHLFGHRKGDHAPRAVLELVDSPRDVRLEMTARAVGRQLYTGAAAAQVASLSLSGAGSSSTLIGREPTLDAAGVDKVVSRFLSLTPTAQELLSQAPVYGHNAQLARTLLPTLFKSSFLNATTKENVLKVTQFGGRPAVETLLALAIEHLRYLSAQEELNRRNEDKAAEARKGGNRPAAHLTNVAPRGQGSITPRSAELRVPISSSYSVRSSARSTNSEETITTRRRFAGEWRPHVLSNTPSSAAAALDAGIPEARGNSRRLARQATHGGSALRLRRGGSESAIALGKGVFARKRLGRKLELLGMKRSADQWKEVDPGSS
ncbi:54S ribosomal protein L8, mitochondrial [Tilletia horrida]|uniref:54S ribosomal protein L8, mitochondrial n=1 Tax=Tilletia horrida TaxID=155126 RepID=A0AAN6JVW5_9BASI|nr:54S ribosomal protein L8, mitochondrial [Tilletia horrida]